MGAGEAALPVERAGAYLDELLNLGAIDIEQMATVPLLPSSHLLHVFEFSDAAISRENVWLDGGAIVGQLLAAGTA